MASIATRRGYAGSIAAQNVRARKARVRTASNRKQALVTVILIGAILLVVVLFSAASANVKLDNNRLEGKNANIEAEIAAIKGEMSNANNINIIEDKAMNELGMVRPNKSNIIGVDGKKSGNIDLAKAIREEAFN